MIVKKRLILASQSPRRRALLKQLGLEFEIQESGVPEDFASDKSPSENVRSLAIRKAAAVAERFNDAIVIGADTTVVLNDKIFGKPVDENDAVDMLQKLSGKTHQVYTGFALFDRPSNKTIAATEKTDVTFRTLSREEIRDYVKSGSPMDKAGAYGIQDDYGAVFVSRIEGCFYNVVGFPLTNFYTTLHRFQQQLGM